MRRPSARPAANPSTMPSRMRAPAATRMPSRPSTITQQYVRQGNNGMIRSALGQTQMTVTNGWLPSVTNLALGAPLGTFVVDNGTSKGWLYKGPGVPPRAVTILARQAGGPSGQLVRISSALAASLANPPVGSDDFVATPSGDPTAGCCFVEEPGQVEDPDTGMMLSTGGYISCPGGGAQWEMHGRQIPAVTMAVFTDASGLRFVTIETGDATITLPICSTPTTDSDDPQCCVDVTSMRLACTDPSSPLHGAQVTAILAEQPSGLLSLSFIDPRDNVEKNGRFMPCPTTPPGACCYDRATNTLRCDAGDPRDGLAATAVSSAVTEDGTVLVVVSIPSMGGQQITIPACPEDPPGVCCYDTATGTLRCPGNAGLNGQQVALVAMAQQPDGSVLAIVQIQGQSGVSTFPICEDQVSDCCYDAEAMVLRCPNNPSLDGTSAAVVSSWLAPGGVVWVWASWSGGGARMPLCPGQTECPPVFCCVNVETMRFVCPGRPEVNGQIANVVDIVTDGGFNWGMLPDGSRIPLCGRDCPPPEICKDCPNCPPGMWTSPDGACTPPPGIPKCPKGTLLDTDTMQCVDCNGTPCPPYPGVMSPVRQVFVARGAIENPGRSIVSVDGRSYRVISQGDRGGIGSLQTPAPDCPGDQVPWLVQPVKLGPGGLWQNDGPRVWRCPVPPGSGAPVPAPMTRGLGFTQRRTPFGRRRLNPDVPWWKNEGHCCEGCARTNGRKINCGCDSEPRETNPSSHALVVNAGLARALARMFPKWIALGIERRSGTVLKLRGGASWTNGACSPGTTLLTIVPPGAVSSGVPREVKICRPIGAGAAPIVRRQGRL